MGARVTGVAVAFAALTLGLAALGGDAGATSSNTHGKVTTIHVSTATVKHVGRVLTTGSGLTLYRFTSDPMGKSVCTGVCARQWPPFAASKGDHVAGPKGVKGLSVIDVGHGRWQVAFDDVALYRFKGDSKKGQAKGQGVEGTWFAVLKSGIPASPSGSAGTVVTTPTSAPTSSTTQPITPTTQAQHSVTTTTRGSTGAQTPVTSTPITSPPTTPPTTPPTSPPPTTQPPPTTTPTTQPPPTTTTTSGGGGYGY